MKEEELQGTEKKPNQFKRVESHLQSRTIDGLMELVPTILTIVVVAFIVGWADEFVMPVLERVLGDGPWLFPGVGIIISVILFYLTGLLIKTSAGRGLMIVKDRVLRIIPVVRSIFGVAEQITSSLSTQYNFSRVVFLEWPREGMLAMGFVTGRAVSADRSIVMVYIPTVPNPTSGNLAFVDEDHVMETDMDVEKAMKVVFSGGIVLPDAISLARVPMEKSEEDIGIVGQFTTGK